MAQEERILLIRLSHLGDVVHALPLYHALRLGHPNARIAWAVEPPFAGLLDGLPGLERAIPFERRRNAAAWPRIASELARFNPTWTVDAQGNLKSAAVSLCAPSARRSGLSRRDWRERLGALVLHDQASPVPHGREHALDRMRQLAAHVGVLDGFPCFDLGLTGLELAQGERAMTDALGSGPDPSDVLLALSSVGDVRGWPLGHWASLVRGIVQAGRRVLILSGPAEAALGQQLARELGELRGARHWIGQAGLRELAAAYALASRAGATYVGVDSGPMHLAAAMGLSVVALAGPQSHLRTGPWPPPERAGNLARHRIVRATDQPACAPCFARRCTHRDGPVCMERIDSAQVLAALEAPSAELPRA